MCSNQQVRVVGHVSRPVFGEGRQTPDRQMFFVNGRPAALPQVAKVFNEVYKSYNLAQSPFIFANVVLDTSRSSYCRCTSSAEFRRCIRCQCVPGQTNHYASRSECATGVDQSMIKPSRWAHMTDTRADLVNGAVRQAATDCATIPTARLQTTLVQSTIGQPRKLCRQSNT